MKTILSNLKRDGYHIFRGAISNDKIPFIKYEISALLSSYSEDAVKDRLFYRREDSHNRQGDAFMVSDSETELPSLNIKETFISNYFDLYNEIISRAIGISQNQNPESKRTMMNVQQYYKDSLPTYDHFDGEFLKYHHEFDTKYQEDFLVLEKAILPRYVMVCVLENENDGKGVYVRKHDSDERIDIELFPGDILIFDNINMRHGVPALPKPRMMFGFRNFDYEPVLFENKPEGGKDWIELQDNKNPGWIMDINSEYSKEIQKEFNKIWKEKGYDENVKSSKPAF